MKRKINILHIIIVVLVLLIASECVFLFVNYLSKSKKNTVGVLSATNDKVFINNIQIPAYGYNNKAYIAAEDLKPFGVSLIKSSNNLTLACEEASEIPDDTQFSEIKYGTDLTEPGYKVLINGQTHENFTAGDYNIIPAASVKSLPIASLNYSDGKYSYTFSGSSDNSKHIEGSTDDKSKKVSPDSSNTSGASRTYSANSGSSAQNTNKKIIVLDPGHGKSSGSMSAEEKEEYGWVYNSNKKQWGEWRHWKSGTIWQDCAASGCCGRVTPNGACWYPMVNGDRDTEPDLNLQNCLSAKKYLEQMGYVVRLTRSSNNENPSITQRLTYCYPNRDTSSAPDADVFICVHSNAGGGKGTAYIELEGPYDQKGISSSYAEDGNRLGKTINDEIAASTSMSRHGNGVISGQPELIAFCKSPVTCGYLEIGFFDNANDLSILKSESDSIGKAIANGIDKYFNTW